MKLISRTLIILAAALLVAGALFAFGQSSLAAQLRAADHAAGEGFAGRPGRGERGAGFADDEHPEGAAGLVGRPEGRGGDHDHGPSLLGLADLGRSLLKIAVIVALFAVAGLLLGRRRPRSALSSM
jgi:hypothetical protein